MTATASVSSPWIPEDDLLLKNSIEGGASLEALAKGAVKFSRRFTFREIRDRWYSLLYDPDVSAQASARMAELELSGSNPNPSSKFKLDNLKGTEKVLEKRKTGSIRKQYHSWRKRIKNEFFSSQNLGFYEERSLHNYNHPEHKFQDHVTTNHVAPGGDAMLDDCLANNLGFEEKDFEILRQAFPESIGSIATTATTTVIDNHNPNPFHMERCHKSVENDFINGREEEEEGDLFKFPEDISPSRNELIGSFDPIKNATCASETPPNLKTDKPESGFGGKHHFSSPVSDGSASFPLSFSSPSTRLPLWKTLEDVSAPDMPVDDNNAESHQVTEETLPPLPDDSDHIRENKTSPGVVVSLLGNRPNGFINSSGVHEGEYTDLPDSLLNLSNEDDILFMDVDVKDHMKDTMDDVPNQEVDLCNVDVIPGVQDDVASTSTSVSQIESVQLTEGQIICTLNREDPDIPCNDDIFLLIHPSTPFPPCIGQVATTDSMCPLSPSSHEKDEQGIITVRKGKDLTPPCFPRPSALPEFGSVFKREPSEVEYRAPLPVKPNNHLRIPGQTRSMQLHTPLEITRNGMVEEGGAKAELQGLGSPTLYNEMPLPLEVGSVKMIDPESMDDSNVSDQNNSDDDADIPYFSDVEAMILEMDLTHAQESCLASEVVRNEYEGNKKMIIRLEQAARSSFQRALSSQGALAIFYGRRLKHYIKKAEVTIGRSTDDTEVDIDLRKEGRANTPPPPPPLHEAPNPNPKAISNLKKKRNLPGTPDPDAEVMALSPKSLMATNRFVCEICNKGFQRDQNLQLHRRGHNLPWKLKQRNNKEPIKKKVYICPEKSCVHHDPSRALGDLTGIKKHFSRKHGEKKWKCEKCSKKYAVQSDWKAHSKTCGTREYKCDCGTLFSRKDSFITHRAFCDALAEESVRLTTVTPNSLGLKNEAMNESVMNPNFPHGFSGMTQFGSGFRSDFGDQNNKPRLSLWLDQANSQLNLSPMDQMAMNSNLYMSSSSAGLADMVNVFGSSPMTNFTNSNQIPSLSLTPEGLKEETLASLYSMNQTHQTESTGPMSATALLQKAAQMGSTRSNPSIFGSSFGLMNSSTTSNTAVSLVNNNNNNNINIPTSLPHIATQPQVSTPMNNNSSNSSPQARQQMIMSRNETMPPLKMMQRSFSGVDNGLTRDFLGMGGEGGRPLMPQDLVKFASYGSTMGSMRHFASNN